MTEHAVSRCHDRLDVAERALAKPASGRVPRDFGDLTWLRHFDDDDLATFISEVRAAVSVAYHDDDLTELDQLVRDWRITADELADPAAGMCFSAASPKTTLLTRSGQGTLRDRQRLPAVSAAPGGSTTSSVTPTAALAATRIRSDRRDQSQPRRPMTWAMLTGQTQGPQSST